MKFLIIEDEQHAAQRLQQLLFHIDSTIQTFGPIDTITSSVEHLTRNQQYDAILLDIQLADGKSFTIFERVRINIPIIFITAYNEFAIKAFEFNSIDYLLKPVQIDKLRESINKLNKIREYYQKQNMNENIYQLLSTLKSSTNRVYKTRFLVSKADTLIPINIDEVAWFVAEDKTVKLCTTGGQHYFVNYSLDDLEQKLDPISFSRINRQYICSLKAIRKVRSYFNYRLKIELAPVPAEEEIMISKSRTSEFKSWLDDSQ